MIYNGRYAYHTHSDLNHYQENAKSFFFRLQWFSEKLFMSGVQGGSGSHMLHCAGYSWYRWSSRLIMSQKEISRKMSRVYFRPERFSEQLFLSGVQGGSHRLHCVGYSWYCWSSS